MCTVQSSLHKSLILLMAASILPACTAVIVPHVEDLESFRVHAQDPRRNAAIIEYKVVPDVRKACAWTGKKDALACASWSYTLPRKCTIYVESMSTEVMLGHEVRHCVEGHFH